MSATRRRVLSPARRPPRPPARRTGELVGEGRGAERGGQEPGQRHADLHGGEEAVGVGVQLGDALAAPAARAIARSWLSRSETSASSAAANKPPTRTKKTTSATSRSVWFIAVRPGLGCAGLEQPSMPSRVVGYVQAPRMRRTLTSLADGRELIYFDETRRHRPRRRRPPRPAAAAARLATALRPPDRRVGRHRRAPPDPHAAAARRRMPAVPVHAGRATEIPAYDYDVVVFENRFPSFADRRRPRVRRPRHCTRRGRPPADARSSASPPTTTSFGQLTPQRVRTVLDALADRTSALGVRCRGRAGLLLREPGRRDRRDAAPPARPDLRLPLRHPPHPHPRRRPPAHEAHRRQPVRRRPRRRTRRRHAHRGRQRALDRVRAVRRPLAVRGAPGRTAGSCPTCRALADDEATRSPRSTSTCCAASTPCSACRCPTSPRGTRPRCGSAATSSPLPAAVLDPAGPNKLKYLAGSESGMGVFINDVLPSRPPRCSGRWPVTAAKRSRDLCRRVPARRRTPCGRHRVGST